ncbi:CMRF35-like molecule 1 [Sander lucioperca]|uniref:CMRF35-like molecule 1 n=1 Tax=Sander lucioperca TaxID=283035 RepID=UPI00125E0175|nr:CMRF35-like molecule 1 [Sander lucioperca]
MNVCQSLICFFFLTLQDGNIGLINAEIIKSTGTEGGNITVGCSFTFTGKRRIFCKDECKEGDILIETEEDTAQRGRYSIEYKNSATVLYVSITKLNKSDSGRYWCRLVRSLFPSSYQEIEIRVTDAPTSPLRPSSPSVPSASTLMTSQSLSSTPSSASPETSKQPPQKHTSALLYVGLTLVVFFIMLSVALLIFCRMRARKPKEPPLETEYAIVTEANRVYEEIREDRQSTSPPVEVSTVYTYAKYTKPDGVETTEEYSLVTAPTSQKKTEDDWSDLTYSELDVPNGTAASLHSAPCGDADNVVYSVPRVEASSASSHAQDASPPLYSTVTSHQL